jgi:hypothetical protein
MLSDFAHSGNHPGRLLHDARAVCQVSSDGESRLRDRGATLGGGREASHEPNAPAGLLGSPPAVSEGAEDSGHLE